MKFIHTADIHLGAEPDAGSSYSTERQEELWNSFERLLDVCEEEQTDLLLGCGRPVPQAAAPERIKGAGLFIFQADTYPGCADGRQP